MEFNLDGFVWLGSITPWIQLPEVPALDRLCAMVRVLNQSFF